MKIKEFIDRFTENWPIKATCILLAVCIYAFYTLSLQDSRSFTVPLKVKTGSGIVPASPYPSRVKVKLKGKTEEIASIQKDNFSAYLDLNYLPKNGSYKVPVLIELPQEALLLDTLEVTVSPQEVSLKVEEKISAFVSASPLINGSPAHGYEVKSVSVKPDTVEITGPRSMVENCTRLQTKAVSVKNADKSFAVSVMPENPGSYLKFKNPDEKLTVTVEVVPVVSEAAFEIPTVMLKALAEGFDVSPKTFPGELTLSGNLSELEKFTVSENTLWADAAGISEPGVYELDVKAFVPAKFAVKSFSPQKIKVSVEKLKTADEFEEKVREAVLPPETGEVFPEPAAEGILENLGNTE
ncbi:YbbR-like domain-containing protein [Treponema berlinense]|uniref:CdaR family protein n=1 Tax=Treponema berlinense TaxID=225004 RepID=UPI0026EF6450|nr:CdaR family protein [Treponema berlinense]